jgi:hypothetical protein
VFWVVDPCVSELVGDARQLSPSAQEALRLRAVAALAAGRTREDVAAVFQVSLKAVDNWWAKWLAGGVRRSWPSRVDGAPASTRFSMWSSSRRSGRPYRITGPVTWGWPGSCGRVPEWGT